MGPVDMRAGRYANHSPRLSGSLLDTAAISCSPVLSPKLPDKIDFLAFLCFMLLSKLKFFIFIVRFLVHLCTPLVTDKDYFNDENKVSWYVLHVTPCVMS